MLIWISNFHFKYPTTLFWVDPVNDITAVFFVQIFPFDGQLHKRFRDAVYGAYTE